MNLFCIAMQTAHKYNTIINFQEGKYSESGSKFLAYGIYAENSNIIKEKKSFLKKLHPKAVHIAYAYCIGKEAENQKASDDGEPSGSAGKPILNVIKKNSLSNIAIFVIRYYGGKKLGIAGLIHAYSVAASDLIKNSEMKPLHNIVYYRIICSTTESKQVMHVINTHKAEISSLLITGESCNFIFSIEKEYVEMILSNLKVFWKIQIEYVESN